MDGISLKITQGDRVALNLAKTLLTTPTLINTDITQGELYSVPLECEAYSQDGQAQVSESLVIVKTGKVNVSDNVAPGAWSWNLQGYITGSKVLEPTNYYTPFVRLNTDIVKQWFKKGAVLVFKDGEAQKYERVVIQSLKISQEKDCRNATPFSMTLKEINVMDDSLVDLTSAEGIAKAAAGKILGKAKQAGLTMAKPIAMGTKALGTVVGALKML